MMTQVLAKLICMAFGAVLIAPLAWAQALPLRVGVLPISDAMQVFVADAKGFFKQEGLQVTIMRLPGGAAIASAAEGGSLDIGFSALVPLGQAHAKGFQFVTVAPATVWDESPYRGKKSHTVLMVQKNSALATARDLEGRKVSVVALNSLADLAFTAWADKQGAAVAKIQKLEIGFPQQEAALQRGQVDAIFQAEPFFTSTLENNVGKVLADFPYSGIAPRFQLAVWFAKKDWAEAHPKEVTAFINAMRLATQFINSNPGDARKILTGYTKLSDELAAKIALPVFSETWRKDEFQVVIDTMAKYRFLAARFDADVMISRYMK